MLERLAGWMDPSGEYLDRGGLYTSSDFGDSWNFKQAGDFWYSSIACSANGSIAVAANGEAGIYVSYDSGDTWTLSSAKDGYGNFWVTVTMNDPGQYLAAGTWASGIYVSFDYGVTWETTNAPIRYYWISLTSDATGRLLAAGYLTSDVSLEFDSDANFGYIYTSSNYGVSWTLSKAPPDDWISIVSSFNGRNLVAVEEASGTYYSNDFGMSVLVEK